MRAAISANRLEVGVNLHPWVRRVGRDYFNARGEFTSNTSPR
jgi:hypothetical protein